MSENEISVSGADHSYTPFVDNLLFFSDLDTNCGQNAISISGNSQSWTGIVYAPKGRIHLSGGSASSVNGSYVAQEVHVSGCCETLTFPAQLCTGGGVYLTR